MGITLNPEPEDRIAAKVRSGFYQSPTEVVQAGLELLEARDSLAQAPAAAASKQDTRPIWEIIAEIGREIPEEEWAKLPTDMASNVDHYLYGAPRSDSSTDSK
jgi:Arc/MetJ-type ribon-helix-helix transcriptional regulator